MTDPSVDPYKRYPTKHRGISYRLRSDGKSRTYFVSWQGSYVKVDGGEKAAIAKQAELRGAKEKGQNPIRASKRTFREQASEWLERRRHEVDTRTVEHYEWALEHLLPFFGPKKLSDITPPVVKGYTSGKLAERKRREENPKELRADLKAWWKADPRARGPKPSRGLSNASINKTLKVLAQVLDEAVDDRLLAENPARGKKRRLRADKPKRTWLVPHEVRALLAAAGKHRALLATMVYAGLRVSELTALRWRDVDLAGGKLKVVDSKTDAGVRAVDLTPDFREELTLHRADSEDTAPEALVFGTSNGTPRNRSNITRQILRPAIERANVALAKEGRAPIEGVTNHSLRRTFCALLYESGESPAYVMAQMGHTDAGLALQMYAKVVLERGDESGKRRDALIRGASRDAQVPKTVEKTPQS